MSMPKATYLRVPDGYLSIADWAHKYGVSTHLVYSRCHQGKLPYIKPRGVICIADTQPPEGFAMQADTQPHKRAFSKLPDVPGYTPMAKFCDRNDLPYTSVYGLYRTGKLKGYIIRRYAALYIKIGTPIRRIQAETRYRKQILVDDADKILDAALYDH